MEDDGEPSSVTSHFTTVVVTQGVGKRKRHRRPRGGANTGGTCPEHRRLQTEPRRGTLSNTFDVNDTAGLVVTVVSALDVDAGSEHPPAVPVTTAGPPAPGTVRVPENAGSRYVAVKAEGVTVLVGRKPVLQVPSSVPALAAATPPVCPGPLH